MQSLPFRAPWGPETGRGNASVSRRYRVGIGTASARNRGAGREAVREAVRRWSRGGGARPFRACGARYLPFMRLAFALCLVTAAAAAPAAAWEFTGTPVCTLSHATEEVEVVVTFDPAIPEYAIALTLADGVWPVAPVFAITFDGGWPLTIQTDRHVLSDDARTLTVRDTGFGNVLDGIGRNGMATALLPGVAVAVPLTGAGGPLAEFRACPAPQVS